MTTLHRNMTEAKTLITSSEEAKEAGRWDALNGQRLNTDAYAFADANSIAGSYLSGDYTYAFIQAKGL
jgi:hypothetical protein